eukprot:1358356-Pyramimonas_sp.AAC.1
MGVYAIGPNPMLIARRAPSARKLLRGPDIAPRSTHAILPILRLRILAREGLKTMRASMHLTRYPGEVCLRFTIGTTGFELEGTFTWDFLCV